MQINERLTYIFISIKNSFFRHDIYPSKDGISHSPLEWSDWEDVEKGANVLLNTVLKIDNKNK